MTSQHDKPKRWRPRFSLRTLVIVVTLVCCYAACWGPTKTQGVKDVENFALSTASDAARADYLAIMWDVAVPMPSAAMPLVVVVDRPSLSRIRRDYYFWFFGFVAKLPYEREVGAF